MTTFEERLGDALDRRGMTQRELAKELGTITESAISKWSKRGLPESIDTLRRMCEILDVSSDELLGLSSAPAPSRGEVAAALVHLRRAVGLLEERMKPEELEAAYRQLEIDAQQTGRPSTVNEPEDSYLDRDR